MLYRKPTVPSMLPLLSSAVRHQHRGVGREMIESWGVRQTRIQS